MSIKFAVNSLLHRLEGTPAYLPPEVLQHKVRMPGFAADAWALGCLTFFCLYGRPKHFGDAEQVKYCVCEMELLHTNLNDC